MCIAWIFEKEEREFDFIKISKNAKFISEK